MFERRITHVAAFVFSLCFLSSASKAEVLDFAARLDGDCAASGSSFKGWGTFNIDTSNLLVSYRVDYDPSIEAEFAHVHGPILNGCNTGGSSPIIFFLPVTNPMIDDYTLVSQEFDEMISGLYYANIHTVEHTGGIITGHLYPVPKSRFLTIVPFVVSSNSQTATQALRVKLVSLHHPVPAPPGTPNFAAFENQYRWVGPPTTAPEGPGGGASFHTAALQCTPHFADWSVVPFLLHVYGAEVVPSSNYEIEAVDDDCPDLNDPGCYTLIHTVRTARWADLIAPFAEITSVAQPNFTDISALVGKFMALPGALIKARAQLRPNIPDPNSHVNFLDISACVDAFQGKPYGFAGPTNCP